MTEDFLDPYTYPGSPVLRNIPGKRTQVELDRVEYRLTFNRREELALDPITGSFDFGRLLETHRRLFQDVYAWAGQVRTVEISKGGSNFHRVGLIPVAAAQVFDWLQRTQLLTPEVDDEMFVQDASDLMEKLNFIHPFREGNGRAQRAFLDQVAAQSNRTLSWRNVNPEDQLRAAVNAFRDASGEPFQPITRQALRAPIHGLSPLDRKACISTAPITSNTRDDPSRAERRAAHLKRFPERRDVETDPTDPAGAVHKANGPELG